MQGNRLAKSEPELFQLTQLQKLNLSNNKISDLWAMPASLVWLSLSDNSIRSLEIELPSSLLFLDVSYNKISSLRSISNLSSLERLSANFNKIQSVDGIPFLSLKDLEIEGNFLRTQTDLEVLHSSPMLSNLKVKMNPLQE